MRQIIFRGYNLQEQEWMYGSLLESWQGKCRIIWEEPTGEIPYPDLIECNYEVERDSVGQLIGVIEDKSHQQIFEGDYVRASKGIGEIVYDVEKCMFMIKWHTPLYKQIRGKREPLFANSNIALEVIGNNYDNDLEEYGEG